MAEGNQVAVLREYARQVRVLLDRVEAVGLPPEVVGCWRQYTVSRDLRSSARSLDLLADDIIDIRKHGE